MYYIVVVKIAGSSPAFSILLILVSIFLAITYNSVVNATVTSVNS